MKMRLDNNVPRLLRYNLPNHQVDTAFERNWHTLTNGELLEQAESDQYQLLITADQRLPTSRTCPAEISASSSSPGTVETRYMAP